MQVKAIDRQKMRIGPDALQTKTLWLDVIKNEIDYGRPWRDMSIVIMARKIGKSPGTFYWYWDRLETAVAELAHAKLDDDQPLSERHLAILRLISLGMEGV